MSNSLIASLRNRVQGDAPKPAPETPVHAAPEHAAPETKQVELPFAPVVHTVVGDPINPPESALPPAPLPEAKASEPKKERKPRAKKNVTGEDVVAKFAERSVEERAKSEETGAISAEELQREVDKVMGVDVEEAPRAFGFTLYVDCLPVGAPVVEADELLSYANAIVVERQKGTDDPVEHYSFIAYGKGRGAITLALEEVLDLHKYIEHVYCASSSDALPVLTKRALRIVRGVR